ncbi:VPLPA-CTERM sorting domain-containing protein [uncultured Tateyamaria sp.]|uniref:VPLPA-CTERM sorting domain-containing protein n=1 Tax=uncultured Tateyamaria sp. TaxID=455651 RepID=UPI002625D9F1|nr:VPLPA-CTERM sorting domain-containing protein [uncultured Tateyamaria sp.]
MRAPIFAAVLALALPGLAQAAPITFFGEDMGLVTSVPAGGAAETARNNFVAALDPGVGTEDFEGFAQGTLPPLPLVFPVTSGNVTATLTGGSARVENGVPFAGRFATSGSNWVEVDGGGGFNIAFTSAISAFGFYGTDIGDFGGTLSLALTAVGGAVTNLVIPNSTNANDGGVLFFGFLDLTESYTNIAFSNSSGADFFGFDDMIVGDLAQIVNPPAVPLPAAGWMLLAGLGGMGLMRRKQKRQS